MDHPMYPTKIMSCLENWLETFEVENLPGLKALEENCVSAKDIIMAETYNSMIALLKQCRKMHEAGHESVTLNELWVETPTDTFFREQIHEEFVSTMQIKYMVDTASSSSS